MAGFCYLLPPYESCNIYPENCWLIDRTLRKIYRPMKIILRKWEKGDITSLASLANNKKIADNLRDRFPSPYTLDDAKEWVTLNKHKSPTLDFAIEAGSALVGGCGILLNDDVYRCSAEIGYWLGESFWGKGIATEAVRQLVEQIRLDHPEITRIYGNVFAQNKGSMRVLEKNDFHLESIRKRVFIKNNLVADDYVWIKLIHS